MPSKLIIEFPIQGRLLIQNISTAKHFFRGEPADITASASND
jgi:hypothetical protein